MTVACGHAKCHAFLVGTGLVFHNVECWFMVLIPPINSLPSELDHPKAHDLFNKEPRRVTRIARGSGTAENDVGFRFFSLDS